MNAKILGSSRRSGLAAVIIGAFLAPALVTDPGAASASPQYREQRPVKATGPQLRKVSAPNTFFPVTGGGTVRDLRSFSSRHRGTDLAAPCDSPVVAAHPGIVRIETSTKRGLRYAVRVVTKGRGGLVTGAAGLSGVTVQPGQMVAAGQQIGAVARTSRQGCGTFFSVKTAGRWRNPSKWLDAHVGAPPPVGDLFSDPGFVIASFNVLGATHTRDDDQFPVASERMPKEYRLLQLHKVDVAGLQEFQDEQKAQFEELSDGTFGIYHFVGPKGKPDTDNAIIWRKSVFEFVSGDTYDVPYFNGNIRHMPIVLLRNRLTGRSAYFMNTHNPADVRGPAQEWRDQAVEIQRQKMAQLGRTGRAVFLTGDFNDRQEAFCPLTENMLSVSPNSVPSISCAYPDQGSLDWIFAAGPTRFSWFLRDQTPVTDNLSDHPIVVARAHLRY